LAWQHESSRKFLHQQDHTVQDALTQAFDPDSKTQDVLFHLPGPKAWLRQLVLALVLIGHNPYRAVVELFRDLFDWRISLGTVHNIVASAVEAARAQARFFPPRDQAVVKAIACEAVCQTKLPLSRLSTSDLAARAATALGQPISVG